MAGICSRHLSEQPVEGCVACHSTPGDVFGQKAWDEAMAGAKAAGLHGCQGIYMSWTPEGRVPEPCGFTFYKTWDRCPRCGTPWEVSPTPELRSGPGGTP